jgi:hypothetical protein
MQILSIGLLQETRSAVDERVKPTRILTGNIKVSDMDRFITQLTLSIGKMFLVSMFLPLGVLHGCPVHHRSSRKQRITGNKQPGTQ